MSFILLFLIVDVLPLWIRFQGHFLWDFPSGFIFYSGIPVLGLKANIKFVY